ncbi:MAG TPA: hypothetical protein GXZ47_02920 [Treponema sp.]|nr:hypothetical protein [Treponema sp.]
MSGILLETILFYALSCSTVLVYGIGLERSFLDSGTDTVFYSRIPVLLLISLSSFVVIWFPVTFIFIPLNITYLVPVFSVTVCVFAQYAFSLVGLLQKPSPGEERIFYFGIVFLALFEGIFFLQGLLIIFSGVLSYTLVTTLLFSIRERILSSKLPSSWKGGPIALISLGLLSLAFYAPDVSWWFIKG